MPARRCAKRRGEIMSWIDDKAHAELARVREAKKNQVYPYCREFETGGLHTSIAGKPIINFSSIAWMLGGKDSRYEVALPGPRGR